MTTQNFDLHVENLKIGDWIVVTGDKHVEADRQAGYEIPMSARPPHSGFPFEVLCIQPPFIVARGINLYEPVAFDIRRFILAKVPVAYAAAYVPAGRVFYGVRRTIRGRRLGDGKMDACPRCGSELVGISTPRGPEWTCSADCGFVGSVRQSNPFQTYTGVKST